MEIITKLTCCGRGQRAPRQAPRCEGAKFTHIYRRPRRHRRLFRPAFQAAVSGDSPGARLQRELPPGGGSPRLGAGVTQAGGRQPPQAPQSCVAPRPGASAPAPRPPLLWPPARLCCRHRCPHFRRHHHLRRRRRRRQAGGLQPPPWPRPPPSRAEPRPGASAAAPRTPLLSPHAPLCCPRHRSVGGGFCCCLAVTQSNQSPYLVALRKRALDVGKLGTLLAELGHHSL